MATFLAREKKLKIHQRVSLIISYCNFLIYNPGDILELHEVLVQVHISNVSGDTAKYKIFLLQNFKK